MIKFLIGVVLGAYFHAVIADAVDSFFNPNTK